MRYQQPHKPHTKRLEARGRTGGSWREVAPRAQPAQGYPKLPRRREPPGNRGGKGRQDMGAAVTARCQSPGGSLHLTPSLGCERAREEGDMLQGTHWSSTPSSLWTQLRPTSQVPCLMWHICAPAPGWHFHSIPTLPPMLAADLAQR